MGVGSRTLSPLLSSQGSQGWRPDKESLCAPAQVLPLPRVLGCLDADTLPTFKGELGLVALVGGEKLVPAAWVLTLGIPLSGPPDSMVQHGTGPRWIRCSPKVAFIRALTRGCVACPILGGEKSFLSRTMAWDKPWEPAVDMEGQLGLATHLVPSTWCRSPGRGHCLALGTGRVPGTLVLQSWVSWTTSSHMQSKTRYPCSLPDQWLSGPAGSTG